MKKLFLLWIPVISLSSCTQVHKYAETGSQDESIYKLTASAETTPVESSQDAADDICIWFNEAQPDESRIIGTNKQTGLVIYDLDGTEVGKYPVGRVNNVDIRQRIPMEGDTIDIVGATNRSYNSISLFKMKDDGQLEIISLDEIISNTDEVYGFSFYYSMLSNKLFALQVSKSGQLEQYLISGNSVKIEAKLVRSYDFGNQCEGMVADDELGLLYVAEEDYGIWKLKADPEPSTDKTLIASLNNNKLMADFEGLSLYLAQGKQGYLIASSQGNNSFAVFNRTGDNHYLGSFSIIQGELTDGTSDTDGIDVINRALGSRYPEGLFIAQDGSNREGENTLNQNFKLVSWFVIANTFDPSLMIDTSFSSLERN